MVGRLSENQTTTYAVAYVWFLSFAYPNLQFHVATFTIDFLSPIFVLVSNFIAKITIAINFKKL